MREACRTWAPRLSAWFDGECSDLDAGEVRAHLLGCPGCRATASRWGALRSDLALLDAPEPDAPALQRMAMRFEQGLAREVHDLARALRVWRLAAALALAVGVGVLAADRLFLPGPVQASPQRDMDREWDDFMNKPSPEGPSLRRPQPKPGTPQGIPASAPAPPEAAPSRR